METANIVTALAERPATRFTADDALKASASFWYATALIGQVAFALYVVAFYGQAAAHGRFENWNHVLVGGYVRGGAIGNGALAAHLLLAVLVTLGGLLQLPSRLRARLPALHRWNGRLYLSLAAIATLTGLFAVWTRGTAGGPLMRVGISLNGVLLIGAAWLAWRFAAARRFDLHRRWALRAFVLVSGVWFFRVGLMAWMLINQGPAGVGDDFDGPFVRFWAFGCYLGPLAVLELYLRAGERTAPKPAKAAMAVALTASTLVMGAGVAGAAFGMWLPHLGGR